MSLIPSNGVPVSLIPDDLTLPQFILDKQHPLRRLRKGESRNTPWLIEDETGKAYGLEEIRSRVHGLANGIKVKWNIKDDDVVCIYSANHIDYPTAIWATHRLGAIVSCANPAYTEPELHYQLEAINASIIITHPNCIATALSAARKAGISADRVALLSPIPGDAPEAAIPMPTVDELIELGLNKPAAFVEKVLSPGENTRKLAFLSFSSGTTGKPKAVAIPHYSVIANVLQWAAFTKTNDPSVPPEQRKFKTGDVATAVLPFFHIYGLVVNLHTCIFQGLALVVFSKFSFTDFLKSIEKYRISHLFIVPPVVVLLVKHPDTKKYDTSSLKYCMAGAAPVSAELTKQFRAALPNCYFGQGFGMTETSTVVTMPPLDQHTGGTTGSAGQLISSTVAKVVKTDGSLAKTGESGELYIQGPQCKYNRYLNNPEANAETFVDGWVRTGDEVMFAENGDMFIVDRLKELIKCRGYQVAPAELEGHLLDHPDCDDVGVVGIPDEYSGEVPLAFIALSAEARQRLSRDSSEAEKIKAALKKHVSDHKVRYKWLDGGIQFLDVIPKNPSGKLLRRFLREKAKTLPREQSQRSKL